MMDEDKDKLFSTLRNAVESVANGKIDRADSSASGHKITAYKVGERLLRVDIRIRVDIRKIK